MGGPVEAIPTAALAIVLLVCAFQTLALPREMAAMLIKNAAVEFANGRTMLVERSANEAWPQPHAILICYCTSIHSKHPT